MYKSTKTFGHEIGLSACFRQWRADSHCRFLHGYALAIKFVFAANELDVRNWVVDFGSLKSLKSQLEDTFDHKLLVAENDFPRKMDWPEAINSCNELGKGWRLPSKKELNIMYLNRSKIGRFVEDNYWSMDMVTVRPGNFIYFHVWYQSFDNTGEINTTDKQEELNVRAVKTL